MKIITVDELHEFGRKVENLCDFFLNRLSKEERRNGSKDVMVIEKLKQEASDIQLAGIAETDTVISGLDSYMRGLPTSE